MPDNLRLLILTTRSQLHIGTGVALGAIDRPVSRHTVTRHPNLPSSAQKRALKDAVAAEPEPTEPPGRTGLGPAAQRALFGADAGVADASAATFNTGAAGMLAPQEGQLWLLPVACGAGGGAWVTSPSVWQRLRRSAALAGVLVPAVPCVPATSRACCPRTSPVLTQLQLAPGQDAWVVLGSLPLAHQPPADADAAQAWSAWAAWVATTAFGADDSVWHDLVVERLVIVSDRVLDGLLPLSLVDRARNNVAETVNLWREECVAEDTVFHALVGATPVRQHAELFARAELALDALAAWIGPMGTTVQMGAHASLGQGLVGLHMVPPAGAGQPGTRVFESGAGRG